MKSLIFALVALTASTLHARSDSSAFIKGFVKIRPDRSLYVEHRPAANGKPTIFFCNGLTWSTTQWQPLIDALDKLDPEIGIVLYDMNGMGRTLLQNVPVTYDIPFDGQVQDLKALHDKLNVRGPAALGGLSYGGAVALEYLARYPNDFEKVIAMSPFLERIPEQDQLIRNAVAATRAMNPYNPATDDELYDFYLRQLIYSTYPVLEPVILENPFKIEGVFRMVKGAKNWRAIDDVKKFPAGKLHLMSGVDDPFVKLSQQRNFWDALSRRSQASFLIIRDTQHKLPEDRPAFTAAWVNQILNGNPAIADGRVFDGDPAKGEARSGSIVIPLHQESFCATFLRKVRRPF